MVNQRGIIGAVALVCLALGIVLYSYSDESAGISGSLVRVGLFLGALWLALPDLAKLKLKQSGIVIVIGLGLIVLLAVRPRIFWVVSLLLIAALVLNWVMRKFSVGEN